MKIDWDRPGVLQATMKVEEMAALVAGARLAAAALATRSAEQARNLEQVLAGFDRAVMHLGRVLDRDGVSPSGSGESSHDGTTRHIEGAHP